MKNIVINFHDVQDKLWFEKAIKILLSKYTLVGVDEIEDYYYGNNQLKKACHITVDDGHKSFVENIYPILEKYNVPASLYVSPKVTLNRENFWFQEIENYNRLELSSILTEYFNLENGFFDGFPPVYILKNCRIEDIKNIISIYKNKFNVGDKKPMNMDIHELRKIDKEGLVSIGAHTQDHPILANEDSRNFKLEIKNSVDELSNILGHETKYFAFPNGIPILDFGRRETDFLKEIGVKVSFSTEAGGFGSDDDPLAIPRFGLSFGSENFIRMKLFMGKYWNELRKFKSKDEMGYRNELKLKIDLLK